MLPPGLGQCLVFSACLGRGIGSDSLHFLGTQISPLWVPFPSSTDCTCSASPPLAKVMATETDPKDRESKIAPVQVIPLQQVHPMQKVYPMQPVILVPLNPPEKDYLCLSITSFFFFILLAIPALLFSFKVGTTQLPPTPVAPRSAFSVPSHLPAPP